MPKGDVAIILAGGFDQIALIQELSFRGFYTVLVDYLEAPVAAPYADVHIRESTLDVDAVFDIAMNFNAKYVMTACTDQALLTAAMVSERLDLPFYLDSKTARMVTDKTLMKTVMSDSDIPTSRYVVINSGDDIVESLRSLRLPLVVKPADCNSSKGVVKVHKFYEAYEAIESARWLSRTGGVIAEEFVDGRELSIDAWVNSGSADILCISESSKCSIDGSFTITGSKSISAQQVAVYAEAERIANMIISAFGLVGGPLLIQAIQCPDGSLSVIEFSARMGGGTKYHLIDCVAGVSIIKSYVDFLLGDSDLHLKPRYHDKCFEMSYLYTNGGGLASFKGFDTALSEDLIDSYFIYRAVGSEFDSRSNSGDRAAGIMLCANTDSELQKLKQRAFEMIDLIDIRGHSMLCREMLS